MTYNCDVCKCFGVPVRATFSVLNSTMPIAFNIVLYFYIAVCPARGQTYITGEYCHPHNATCNNPSPRFLCNVSRCECLFGQVLNQETNECVDAATCGKHICIYILVVHATI